MAETIRGNGSPQGSTCFASRLRTAARRANSSFAEHDSLSSPIRSRACAVLASLTINRARLSAVQIHGLNLKHDIHKQRPDYLTIFADDRRLTVRTRS